jgi:hypothetical protein
MATKIIRGDYAEFEYDLCLPNYLDGDCYTMAIALCRGLQLPIYGIYALRDFNEHKENTKPRHAYVRGYSPELEKHVFYDVRGVVLNHFDLTEPFGIPTDFIPWPIAESSLLEVVRNRLAARGSYDLFFVDREINKAMQIMENKFPDLPWKHKTQIKRIATFADELEALCRKHKIWLREEYAASPMIAYEQDDNDPIEDGYSVQKINLYSYGIRRLLK